ncbi:MAG: Flp pilus assembly protein CpaB [Candidatus Pseudomonas phytovorans]|uniref:Flp pilus assembly protein CpaB n=1 Tax=Candidatus Pseudomonas phytovorans TaxID=3121377 RepID=A0AAJ5WC79_9PSED|nr:Flp pilus assembly protein CpaB [Pseudomonas sp.]WEK29036.1 MAG: Flp pilus assembly protein CpaB [Pseudomonas sp.]
MKTPSVLLLAGALVLAGGAALLARVLLAPPAPAAVAAAKPATVEKAALAVLVAANDLRPGQLIDRGMLRWQEVQALPSAERYFQRDQSDLDLGAGAVLRHPLKAGQALTESMLVRAGEPGFLAAVLRPGMRALSLPTSAVAVSQGLVSAGDRVDVILALKAGKNDDRDLGPPKLAAQTLLRDVRVLAINRSTRELTARLNAEAPATPANDKENRYFETVTLEVTPAQAERLALSKEVGSLQLALRGNREPGDGLPRSGSRDVTRLAQATDVFEKPDTRKFPTLLYRGDETERVEPPKAQP